jgi:hypothetical protein
VTGGPASKRRRLAVSGGLVAAAVDGAVAAVAVIGGAPAPAAPAAPPVATARVTRTSLATTVLTEGTLGYASTSPVVNQLTGTFTQIPRAGRRIAAGGTLFRVDDLPVVLMTGRIPAWRPLVPGISNGPDVAELDRNLIALGYAAGLMRRPSDEFTWATSVASSAGSEPWACRSPARSSPARCCASPARCSSGRRRWRPATRHPPARRPTR